jgi:4-amino-4-deoxy-L-arabinose transferase-like glycosyltransferase
MQYYLMLSSPRLLHSGLLLLTLAAVLVLGAALPEAPLWPLLQSVILGGTAAAMVLLYGGDKNRAPLLLGATLIVGLFGRIAAMALGDGTLTAADPMNYQNLAHALLAGNGLVTTDIQYGDVYAHFPPLYPVMLAGFWGLFGDSAWTTLTFAYLCDIIAAWAIFDIGRRSGAESAGRIAGLLLLIYPALLIAAPIPQKESLTVALVVLLVRSMLVWSQQKPSEKGWLTIAATGLWWGLLMLTQPSLALLTPCMGLALIRQRGMLPVLRMGVMAGLVAALVMLPWWVRNYLMFGAFVPFTTAAGFLVNVQLGPNLFPFSPGLFDLPEPERGPVMASAAFQWIAAHPIDHATVLLRRVANVFAYESAAIESYRFIDPPMTAGTRSALLAAFQVGWVVLLAAAAAGTKRLPSLAKATWLAPFIILFTVSLLAVNIWFEFAERHRYALTPFLLLLAALWWTERSKAQPVQP